MSVWEVLGIQPTDNKREIKKAYAKLLKSNNPEDNPAGFQNLRDAYDSALNIAEHWDYWNDEDDDEDSSDEDLDSGELTASTAELNTPEVDVSPIPQEPIKTEISLIEEVRNKQIAEVDSALEQLREAVEVGDHTAIPLLDQFLGQDFFHALDVLYRFEGELCRFVCTLDNFPFYFVEHMALVFDWKTDLKSYHAPISNFENDWHYQQAFCEVFRQFLIETVRSKILKSCARNPKRSQARKKIEEALLTNFSEDRLSEIERNSVSKKFISQLVSHVDSLNYSSFGISPIPWDTISWLEQNSLFNRNDQENVKRNKPEPKPEPVDEDESSVSPWMIIFGLFVIVRLFIYFGESSNSPSGIKMNDPQAPYQLTSERLKELAEVRRREQLEEKKQSWENLKAEMETSNKKREPEFVSRVFKDAGKYEGFVVNGVPEGEGALYYDNGDKFEGEFYAGIRSHGTYTWKSGDTYYGRFVDNKIHVEGVWSFANGDRYTGMKDAEGKWISGKYEYANGDSYDGEFINGQPGVIGTWNYKDGSSRSVISVDGEFKHIISKLANGEYFEGTVVNDKKHGKGTTFYENGDEFDGYYEKGIKQKGTYSWATGKQYEGDYIEGQPQNGTLSYENGDIFSGYFVKGIPSRGSYSTSKDQSVYEGEFINGSKTGEGKLLIDGDTYSGSFINGSLVGDGEKMDSEGNRYIGNFNFGVMHGKFLVIDPEGNRFSTKYKDGERIRKFRKKRGKK